MWNKLKILFDRVVTKGNEESSIRVIVTRRNKTHLFQVFDFDRECAFEYYIYEGDKQYDKYYTNEFFTNFKIVNFEFNSEYNFDKRKSDRWVELCLEDENGIRNSMILKEDENYNLEKIKNKINKLKNEINELETDLEIKGKMYDFTDITHIHIA